MNNDIEDAVLKIESDVIKSNWHSLENAAENMLVYYAGCTILYFMFMILSVGSFLYWNLLLISTDHSCFTAAGYIFYYLYFMANLLILFKVIVEGAQPYAEFCIKIYEDKSEFINKVFLI